MKKSVRSIYCMLLAAVIFVGGVFIPGVNSQAAASYDNAFITEVEGQYEALEDKFTKLYKADQKKASEDYEQFSEKMSKEQKQLQKQLDEDESYLIELLEADYKELEAKYGSQSSYKSKLQQYRNQINPDYTTSALWKYSKEIDKNYSTSLHWKFNNEINPNYSTSMMWKYKNDVNPNYSTSTMWKYKNVVNPNYSTSTMWKLRNESNANYSTSTMWRYKQGNITKADAKKKIDKLLNDGDEDLQATRDASMKTIEGLRNRTVSDVIELRDETVKKIIKQRTTSLEKISELRESYFGSGIQARTLNISFDDIKVIIDGELQQFAQSPFIVNGSTLVPMRAIFERLGATIEWNNVQRSVKAVKGSTTIELTIGSKVAKKNGQELKLDVPGRITNSHTMVPLRFISEALGADVKWNGDTRTITITTE